MTWSYESFEGSNEGVAEQINNYLAGVTYTWSRFVKTLATDQKDGPSRGAAFIYDHPGNLTGPLEVYASNWQCQRFTGYDYDGVQSALNSLPTRSALPSHVAATNHKDGAAHIFLYYPTA